MTLTPETIAECKRLLEVFEKQDQGVTVIAGKQKQINLKAPLQPGQTMTVNISGSTARFMLLNSSSAEVVELEKFRGNIPG